MFPPEVFGANDTFVFGTTQTSFTYNNITVTNLVVTLSYGADTIKSTANLGFAQITLGSGASVTTARIPILFACARTKTIKNLGPDFGNIIGDRHHAQARRRRRRERRRIHRTPARSSRRSSPAATTASSGR